MKYSGNAIRAVHSKHAANEGGPRDGKAVAETQLVKTRIVKQVDTQPVLLYTLHRVLKNTEGWQSG